ncbi:MAG: hypothetical protein A2W31_17925, partial [Planctomycetes bacterium RBG_16_64_10]
IGVACALLAAAIFALDVRLPLGVAGGVLYVAVVLICLWSPARRDTVVAAAACSLLALVSYHFAPPGGEAWQVLANRVLAVLVIWVTALLVLRRKQDLREHDRRLQEQKQVLVELTRSKALGQGDLVLALREITEAAARLLQIQRVGVWLYSDDGARLRCVEQYDRNHDRHTSGAELEATKYPSYFAALETERTVAAGDAARDPRTCEFKQSYLEPHGIASMLDAPIRLRGRTVGVVCHEHVGTPRPWTVEEQNFAGSVADFVDLALEASERKRAEDELRRHRDQLEELVEQRTRELKQVNEQLIDQIDQYKRAAKALEASEENYRIFIENLPVGVYRSTPGPAGRFLLANSAQVRMLGYDSVDAFLATSVAQHYANPQQRQAFSDKLLAEGRVVAEQIQLRRRDGTPVWAAVTAQVIRNDGGQVTHFDGIIEDITARKEVEEKLAQQARELARSNAELEQFAYAVSHDLQEPLRAVAGYCRLLQRRCQGTLDQEASELIQFAVDGATRMKALIDGLLAYSRVGIRDATIRPVDCKEVLDTVLANLRTAVEGAAATVRRAPMPTVMADQSQLIALFQNLIGNAIKYRAAQPPEIDIGAKRCHAEWVFSVRDNGIGVAPGQFERVFAIFQRLHTGDEYPGTGIGLAICKKIVAGLGGRIWVESEPGRGSTFLFSLPAKAPPRQPNTT